jgi:hypothetical protein
LANGGYVRIIAANNGGITGVFGYWAFTAAPILSAGSHTITIRARGNGNGSNATVGGDNSSVLESEVNLTILKQ